MLLVLLSCSDFTCIVGTDASDYDLVELSQVDNGTESAISYFGREVNPSAWVLHYTLQISSGGYCIGELIDVVTVLENSKGYILGTPRIVLSYG
jgi:hypothetical protein